MVILRPLFSGIAERLNTFMTISWRLSVQVGDLVQATLTGLGKLPTRTAIGLLIKPIAESEYWSILLLEGETYIALHKTEVEVISASR